MKLKIVLSVASLAMLTFGIVAQSNLPMVGGAAMYPTKDIVDNP